MTMTRFQKFAVRFGALALCSAALGAAPAMAQGGGGYGGGGGMNPQAQQAQMDAMTKAVGLTPDQVTKIQAINADAMKQQMALRESGGDPQEMRPKMQAIRTDQQTKIKALLTDDQKPKYDAYLASMPQGGRRGGGGGGGGATPPPAAPPQL
jgi:Spy/CpxP family protein refolding chaperone